MNTTVNETTTTPSTTKITLEVELTSAMQEQFETILETRANRDMESLWNQIVARGLYDLSYRTQRNRARYAEDKALREELKALKATLKG